MVYSTIYKCKPTGLAVCLVTVNICSLIARRLISCKPLPHSRRQFLAMPNLLRQKRPGSRSDHRELILVLMRTVRKYTNSLAV